MFDDEEIDGLACAVEQFLAKKVDEGDDVRVIRFCDRFIDADGFAGSEG